MKAAKQSAMALAVVLSLVGVQAHAQSSPSYYGYNNNIATDDISFGTGYVTNGYGGYGIPSPAVPLSLSGTSLSMNFSKSGVAALNAVGIQFVPVGPIILSVIKDPRQQYRSIGLNVAASDIYAGSERVTAITQANEQITKVSTTGSLILAAEADGLTTSGGSLTLSNLTLDASGQRILADVTSSASSWQPLTQASIFDLVDFQSTPNVLQSQTLGSTTANLKLSELGKTVLSNGLGLLPTGVAAMTNGVDVYGNVSLNVGTVPEPSAWMSMGLGILGIGVMARRRQARQSA